MEGEAGEGQRLRCGGHYLGSFQGGAKLQLYWTEIMLILGVVRLCFGSHSYQAELNLSADHI